MKCKICRIRKATENHAKDYNHFNPIKGNMVGLCEECHKALHWINQKNGLDWDYLMENKRQEIIDKADYLEEKWGKNVNKK